MTTLWIDLETFSETPIAHGTYRYAADCEVLLVAWAIDDGPVQVWDVTLKQRAPDALRAAVRDPNVTVIAHNAMFDRNALRLGNLKVEIPVERWECTMVQALSHSLPGKLSALCDLLKVPHEDAKLASGADAIHMFCMPQPKNVSLRRFTRHTHPAEWDEFVRYAGRDVQAMRACRARMPNWNWQPRDIAAWHYDQRINDRGFQVDTELAEAAVKACATAARDNADRTSELTGGRVERVTQRDRLKEFLAEHGVDLPDMTRSTLERRIEDPDLPWALRELLALRLSGAKNSTSKYRSLLRAVSDDGRLRGTMQMRGAARTGRDAGRTFQPQNLPRPKAKVEAIEQWIECVKAGNTDLLEYDDVQFAADAIRGVIIAPPGKKIVQADYSNVEGRIVAWLAGVQWKLQAFRDFDTILGTDARGEPIRKGPDLYRVTYAKSFNIPVDKVTGDERQIGKVIELACGYQGAVGAFQTMATVYGVEVSDDKAAGLVYAWRSAHPEVVGLWYDLERAVRTAIQNQGQIIVVNDKLRVVRRGAWLKIQLPSGRCLSYPHVGFDNHGAIEYAGQDQYTRKWSRILTYGGKLFENVVQAIAADLLWAAIPRAEAAGYAVILRVHDELLTETPDTPDYNAAGLGRLMTEHPKWAAGLPLATGGFETKRYRKG